MESLVTLSRRLDQAVSAVGKTMIWSALALIIVILFDVVTRRFLVLGSTKLQELEWHIHTLLFMSCVGWAYLANSHVRIDIVRERLKERTKLWIETVGCLAFAIPYSAILFYLSIDFAYDSYVGGEISSAGTGLPHRWIIKTFLSIGFALLLLSVVCTFLRHIVLLFAPQNLAERVRTEQAGERTEVVE